MRRCWRIFIRIATEDKPSYEEAVEDAAEKRAERDAAGVWKGWNDGCIVSPTGGVHRGPSLLFAIREYGTTIFDNAEEASMTLENVEHDTMN